MEATNDSPIVSRVRFRKLRIAWSAGCGIACVLLIALWVRSYWVQYRIIYPTASQGVIEVDSAIGVVWVQHYYLLLPAKWNRALYKLPLDDKFLAVANEVRQKTTLGFGRFDTTLLTTVRTTVFTHWFLVLLSAGVGYMSWLPWSNRFGLRTLLLTMTLVAVMLAVFATRK